MLGQAISGRDLILIVGGLFLLAKSTYEIHDKLEGEEGHASRRVAASFASVIVQIMLLDIVFSLDSVITAVGMVDELWVMIAAVIVAVGDHDAVGRARSAPSCTASDGQDARAQLPLLIGMSLLAEGFDHHIPKGYIYFAMGFSVFVGRINCGCEVRQPVQLHERYASEADTEGKITAVRSSRVTSLTIIAGASAHVGDDVGHDSDGGCGART